MSVIKHKSQRVGVFIDTQNLYHSAKNLYGARVNFGAILKDAVGDSNLSRSRLCGKPPKPRTKKLFWSPT